jgi:hypothetical protein
MADLYSIIVLMEHLEKAFIRDSITADEYVTKSEIYDVILTAMFQIYTSMC